MVMFIDALDLNGTTYLHINIKLVSVLGLDAAVYCSEVLAIIKRSINDKSKCIIDEASGNAYVKIDRAYIMDRTSLSIKDQHKCDEVLEGKGLLLKHPSVNNALIIDVEKLVRYIISDDLNPFEGTAGLDNELVAEPVTKDSTKKKRDAIARVLKKAAEDLPDTSAKMKTALRSWVESIVRKSNKRLSKSDFNNFVAAAKACETEELALVIIDTAVKYQYVIFEDAAAKVVYNEAVRQEVNNVKIVKKDEVRKTGLQLATKEDVEGGDEF